MPILNHLGTPKDVTEFRMKEYVRELNALLDIQREANAQLSKQNAALQAENTRLAMENQTLRSTRGS